jgi:hypothetical protein
MSGGSRWPRRFASLRAQGLITSAPDPDDGRRTLISATEEGRTLLGTIPAAREEWLTVAISKALSPDEQQALRKAAAIMKQLADSEAWLILRSGTGGRRRVALRPRFPGPPPP